MAPLAPVLPGALPRRPPATAPAGRRGCPAPATRPPAPARLLQLRRRIDMVAPAPPSPRHPATREPARLSCSLTAALAPAPPGALPRRSPVTAPAEPNGLPCGRRQRLHHPAIPAPARISCSLAAPPAPTPPRALPRRSPVTAPAEPNGRPARPPAAACVIQPSLRKPLSVAAWPRHPLRPRPAPSPAPATALAG